jgi:hypothetical protein
MPRPLMAAGLFIFAVFFAIWTGGVSYFRATDVQENLPIASSDEVLGELKSDVTQLKDKIGDQAHAMVSVAYHFNNIWFAADAKNWPLAEFYWNETRSHLRWAVRIIPIRKDSAGQEIKLRDILEAVENSPLQQLREAIDNKDYDAFVKAYRFTLEGCYACHKASDKPYLRPQIPDRPAEPSINFDPQSRWPE